MRIPRRAAPRYLGSCLIRRWPRFPVIHRFLVVFFLALVAAVPCAPCAVLIVTNTQDWGSGSLRDTVARAAAGDKIEFNIPTTDPGYDPLSGIFTVTLTNGQIVIQNDLTIANASGAKITINGSQIDRAFYIPTGTVAISDLSFVNGKAYVIGGAIWNRGTLTCTRCTFKDNSVFGVRGVSSCYGGNGSGGDAYGGAIGNEGTLSLVSCTLTGNSTTGGDGGVTPAGCIATRPPGWGGKGTGGAIYNIAAAMVTLTNCTITGNTATSGNVSFMTVDGRGGGIANFGSLTVIHSTVANNATVSGENGASLGGGLYCATNSIATTRDAILAENSVVGENPAGPDVAGAVTSQGHNLLGRSDGCVGFTSDDLQGGTTNQTRLDPVLGSLSYQGGTTQTLPLLPGSPAIDAGTPDNSFARDQRYYDRTGVPDIGAFEYQGTEPSLLGNISTRLRVREGDNAMIGGFIITGSVPKTVIVRGIGPSLPLADALANPVIEVHGSRGELLALNDDWRSALTSQDIIGSGLSPTNELESALWGVINPGAYSVIVRGENNSTGIALFEVYDLDQTADAKLGNVSTRGFVETGDNVMIGGTIVAGNAPRVLFRAIGPSLSQFGVSNTLANPTMALYTGNGQLMALNDNWQDSQPEEIIATGLPPSNLLESAVVLNLAPGPYTAIVRGQDNGTGVALIEVYDLD